MRWHCSICGLDRNTCSSNPPHCRECNAPRLPFKTYCDRCRAGKRKTNKSQYRESPNQRSLNNHRRRARHHGVEYEPVNRLIVFERDNWQCGICGEQVNPTLTYPNPMSASLDHIVPMSLGGGHLYSNVQCSHWICNCAASDKRPAQA